MLLTLKNKIIPIAMNEIALTNIGNDVVIHALEDIVW